MTDHSSHTHSDGSKENFQEEPQVLPVRHAGESNEFVIIGNQKFHKHELMQAFGGTLNPGLSPPPVHKFANPSPLGLSAFALTTFVLSMYNARAMGVTTPNIVVGLAAFYGGAVQFLAGVWEMAVGNTFAATALSSYGAFWLLYAAINVPSFGIVAAYEDTEQLSLAVAFFLLAWALFTFMLFLCTLKATVAFALLFGFLTMTFILLSAGDFTGKVGVTRAGGVFGIITAFLGFYNAFAGVANPTNSYFIAHPIPLTKQ